MFNFSDGCAANLPINIFSNLILKCAGHGSLDPLQV